MSTQLQGDQNAGFVPTGTWTVDPAHSSVEFSVKHMMIATVKGRFTEFDGTLQVGEDVSSAKVFGVIKVASIDTHEPQATRISAPRTSSTPSGTPRSGSSQTGSSTSETPTSA